jgi:hypothetical protein
MKFEHFRSDLNGCKSEKPYHKAPTEDEVNKIWHNEKVLRDDGCRVFADDNMVEIRMGISNGIAGNIYRDFYRIIK